jgi:hypothetical protein
MAARLVVIVLALAAAGFLTVQERGARAADAISHAAPTGKPTARQLRTAREEVKTAGRWNPDTDPSINFGILQAFAGDYRAAGATFAAVARKEPQNAQAWALLSVTAARYDSDLAATARARARALEPSVPPAR